MIIALAGRRIDVDNAAHSRFQLPQVPKVRRALHELFVVRGATVLVSSAACGADLLAQSEAGALGIRRRVVIPFARATFRETSVMDRPGEWGPIYEGVMNDAEKNGDLVVLAIRSGDDAYAVTNHVILDGAIRLGDELAQKVCAVIVWDGTSSGPGDHTAAFRSEASAKGLELVDISTV